VNETPVNVFHCVDNVQVADPLFIGDFRREEIAKDFEHFLFENEARSIADTNELRGCHLNAHLCVVSNEIGYAGRFGCERKVDGNGVVTKCVSLPARELFERDESGDQTCPFQAFSLERNVDWEIFGDAERVDCYVVKAGSNERLDTKAASSGFKIEIVKGGNRGVDSRGHDGSDCGSGEHCSVK